MQSARYCCQILIKHKFLDIFWEILKYKISWRYVKGEPNCFMLIEVRVDAQSDGQTGGKTDRMKLIVVFLNSAKVPDNYSWRNPVHFRLLWSYCYVKPNTTNSLSYTVFVLW